MSFVVYMYGSGKNKEKIGISYFIFIDSKFWSQILPFLIPNNATTLSYYKQKNLDCASNRIIEQNALILIMAILTQAFRFCIESLI